MEDFEQKNYMKGIIFALVGAAVGTIPWVLLYVYGNVMIAIVSALIAICSYQGYKMSKAIIDKKLPIIISICSLLSITLATFVVIPLMLLAKEDLDATFENLKYLYEYGEFVSAIVGDYVISILFTFLGIGGIVSNLNKQIKNGVNREDIKINMSTAPAPVTPEETELVKSIFVKYDALTKNNTIEKDEVISELVTQIPSDRVNEIWTLLLNKGIVRRKSKKFYFSEKQQNSKLDRSAKIALITIGVTVLVIIGIAVIASMGDDSSSSSSKKTNKNTTNLNNINVQMPDIDIPTINVPNINNTTNTNTTSNNATSNTVNNSNGTSTAADTYTIKEAGIIFEAKDGLKILSDKEIEYYYGEEYIDFYEFIAEDSDTSRILYCFIDEDTHGHTVEEYMEESLDGLEYDKIEKIKLGGFEAAKATLILDEDYNEDCYIIKKGDLYICFDYCYEEGLTSNFEKMIKAK